MEIYKIKLIASERPENRKDIKTRISHEMTKEEWYEPNPLVKAIFPHIKAGYRTVGDSERNVINPRGLLLSAIPYYYQYGINPLRTWDYSFVPNTLEGFESLFSDEIKLAREKRSSLFKIHDGVEKILTKEFNPDECDFPERREDWYREDFQIGRNFICRRGNNSGILGTLKDVNSYTLALVYAVFKEFIEDAGKDYIQEQLNNNGWSIEKVKRAREELDEKENVLSFTELVSYPHVDVQPLLEQLLKDMRKKGLDVGYFKKIHSKHTVYRVTLAREVDFQGIAVDYSRDQNSREEIQRVQRIFQDLRVLCEGEGLEVEVTNDVEEKSLSGLDQRSLAAPQPFTRMIEA